MEFSHAEVTVFEAIHTFTVKLFKRKLVGLHETMLNGTTMADAIKFLFKKRGIESNYSVVMDNMLKMQWLVFVVDKDHPNGRWGLNTLCTCGRCSKYVQRTAATKLSLGNSLDGKTSKYLRQIFSGKGLNWNSLPYIGEPTPVDTKRRAKAKSSKVEKLKTPKRLARVWNEANGPIIEQEKRRKEKLLRVMEKATYLVMEMEN